MNKNIRVRVVKYTCYDGYTFWLCDGKKLLLEGKRKNADSWLWKTEEGAARNAKTMAKRIGAKFDPQTVTIHGC